MRHLDLFAGIGGFSLAARWMGWETVAQVEWDKWCQKVLAKNFPDALRFGDIKEFNEKLRNGEIITDSNSRGRGEYKNGKIYSEGILNSSWDSNNEKDRRIFIGRIDIITGGFPCQPFSHAGKRKGTDDSRYLWPEMLESIRILKPSFVVGENVAGLVSMENGKTLDRILSDLANEGYTTEQFIIPACALGAWHRRDRIWIVGINTNNNPVGCDNRECPPKERSERGCESFNRNEGLDKNVSDSTSQRLTICKQPQSEEFQAPEGQRIYGRDSDGSILGGCREWGSNRGIKSILGMLVDGLPIGLAGWDREPNGIPRVATGVKDRVNKLKGLGNAIVPQVVFEIFKAIEQYETSLKA